MLFRTHLIPLPISYFQRGKKRIKVHIASEWWNLILNPDLLGSKVYAMSAGRLRNYEFGYWIGGPLRGDHGKI